MAELLDAGYTDLRARALSWELEVRDNGGVAVLRVGDGDPRLTVTDDDDANVVSYVLVLSGDDPEVTLPLTVNGSVLFTAGGTQVSAVETFADFTLGAAEDEVTVTHTFTMPSV